MQIVAVEPAQISRIQRSQSRKAHRQRLLSDKFTLSLIRVPPRKSAEKNFALAQLLRIDPLPPGAYSHFTSHPENQPRAAAIDRTTFLRDAWYHRVSQQEIKNRAALPEGYLYER